MNQNPTDVSSAILRARTSEPTKTQRQNPIDVLRAPLAESSGTGRIVKGVAITAAVLIGLFALFVLFVFWSVENLDPSQGLFG